MTKLVLFECDLSVDGLKLLDEMRVETILSVES